MTALNWGIIGTGAIARAFAHGLSQTETAELVAIGSRDRQTADAFGDEHGVPHRHGDGAAAPEIVANKLKYVFRV